MNMKATYADPAVFTASPWSVDVSGAIRLGSVTGLIERAELGSAGISSVMLDDPLGTLGHSSDAILGLKQIWVDETNCPAGDQRIYTGFIADRKYRRGTDSLITGVARKIDVTLVDANEILTERILHLGFGADPTQPCDRPAETDFERIAWLLITGYVRAVFDHGLVASSGPVNMDATNYEGQKPADVMNDCSQQSGRNHFIYYDEATATYGLFYDFNKSAVYSSSLQISNVLADVDNVTTFAPEPDAELTRDPSRVSAGVYMPFSGGTTYQELLTTAVTYAFRDAAAPSSNVTTLANADIRADRYLTENATEEDRITCAVKLPKAKVTGIKAGHRIQAKFSHLPSMASYTWCRILTRTVKQDELTAELYNVELEMSPEPAEPIYLYGFPYVFGDTAPGARPAGGSYWIGDTPGPKYADAFLSGEPSTTSTDWEAFSDPGGISYLTDGWSDRMCGERQGPTDVTIVTQRITSHSPLAVTPAAKSIDTIMVWQHGVSYSGKYPTTMALTVDGVFVGNFSPVAAPGVFWSVPGGSSGADLDYLNPNVWPGVRTFAGTDLSMDSTSGGYATRYDLGEVVRGTTWLMVFTLVNRSDNWLRLTQIQAFNTTDPGTLA
jgi:hypothetical protein